MKYKLNVVRPAGTARSGERNSRQRMYAALLVLANDKSTCEYLISA